MNEQQNYFYGLIPVEVRMTPERKEEILQQYPAPVLPDDGATFEIDQEAKGNNVTLRLLLNEVSVQTTKTNKQFLKMTFSNNAGTIQAKMWDNQGAVQKNLPQLEAYSVFDVDAVVDEFRGFKSLTIQRLEPCEGEINPFSYLPYTKQSITDYTVEVFSYIDELSSPYREFAIAVMDQFWQEFSISPAAKGFHHNYLGGLLKHTVGLMRFARYIVKQEENPYQAVMKLIQIVEKAYKQELWSNYESEERWVRPVWQETIDHLYQMLTGMMEHKEEVVNYDALLTSILLHDIGKMLEYDFAGKQYDSFDFLYPTLDKSSLKKESKLE